MRLYINHDKPYLIFLLTDYMNRLVSDKRVDLIINGKKTTGVVTSLVLEDEPFNHILVSVNDDVFHIPVLEHTKVRLGKEMIRVETDNHSTIIEILD